MTKTYYNIIKRLGNTDSGASNCLQSLGSFTEWETFKVGLEK